MFRTDITKQVSAGSSPPTLVSDYISRAIRAEYWINKDKEAMAQIFKAKKEEKAVVKQSQPQQNQELYLRGQSGNAGQNPRQFGKNKRRENATSQGQQRNYPQKKINRDNGGKYHAKIDCRKHCVMFSPLGEEKFNFYGQSRSSSTRLVLAMKAWKMCNNPKL
ncbi:hypothetical protein TIFTF001_031656 [Ficus carica]|uniref:Uncharacterized protein n=1 Tax=Ficus carica TaxID=3494 RepID=A0AA88DVL2_FICCA|nr:hypothetical protein TIFTF001_031656 [Ficus carica]